MGVLNTGQRAHDLAMDMSLKLSSEQGRALDKAAAEDRISKEGAALGAITLYILRRKSTLLESINRIKTADSETLKRLAV